MNPSEPRPVPADPHGDPTAATAAGIAIQPSETVAAAEGSPDVVLKVDHTSAVGSAEASEASSPAAMHPVPGPADHEGTGTGPHSAIDSPRTREEKASSEAAAEPAIVTAPEAETSTGVSPTAELPGTGAAGGGETPTGTEAVSAPSCVTPEGAEAAVPVPPPPPPQPVPPVPPAPQPHELARIAQDLQIRKSQVEAVLHLLDEHYAPPFIARYRKDQTGGLSEEIIRRIQQRVRQCRELAARKQSVLRTLAHQHRLTEELTQAILHADSLKRVEDLFLPYRQKKKSVAREARDKGLGPAAEAIWNRDPAVAHLDELLAGLVNPDKWLLTPDDVLAGIKSILKEIISEQPDLRGAMRQFMWETGMLVAQRIETLPETKGKEFQPYFDFKEAVREIPPHRVLAITRGERLNILRVRIDVDRAKAIELALQRLPLSDHPHRDLLMTLTAAAVEELLLPALEKEVRRDLLERAQDHAVQIFARNLRSLLLQSPVRGKKVLAIDPNNRQATTVVVLDEDGNYIEDAVIHLSGPQRNLTQARLRLEQLIRRHQVTLIAIGNGANYREAEALVSELIADLEKGGGISTLAATAAEPTVPASTAASEVASSAASQAAVPPVPPAAEVVLTSETILPTVQPAATFTAAATAAVPPVSATFTTTTIDEPMTTPAPAAPLVQEAGPTTVGGTAMSGSMPPLPAEVAVASPASAPAEATISTTSDVLTPVPAVAAPPSPAISLEGLPPAPSDLVYAIVLEAGIRDYARSPIAQEEFPTLAPAIRAAISIGRRLLDPLAELVKIEPHHIGVGLYQHDVKQKQLREALEAVIASCVNTVGVDLNRAEFSLLRHVCGLNPTFAREIVARRRQQGPFRHRRQLLEISGLTEKHYTQAAGFVRVCNGEEPLDEVWIHPEQYDLARALLDACGFTPADLRDATRVAELRPRLAALATTDFAARFHVSEGTVRDVINALSHPGRDVREDHPPPIFKRGMLKFEDIRPGMELKGTVLNVVTFGAFVDIGLRESGLVHISQMANRFIRSPYEVVSVGDVVTVWVLDVKAETRKISLTMIPPGQERRLFRGSKEQTSGSTDRSEPAATSPVRRDTVAGPRRDRGRRPPSAATGGRSESPRGGSRPRTPRGPRSTGGPVPAPSPAATAPAASPASAEAGSAPTSAAEPVATPQPPPPPPPPPRRPPARPKPLPTLTPEKRSGKTALNTFAELAAFFQHHQEQSSASSSGAQSETPAAPPPQAAHGSPGTNSDQDNASPMP